MNYPKVIDEFKTIERALAGENLARYGDGELKLAFGRDCVSQVADNNLQAELLSILAKPQKGVLPCIPNIFSLTPKASSWLKFSEKRYVRFYNMGMTYGSSFITRPDSAPWIDKAEYWERIRSFWKGKDVMLVAGTERSLREETLFDAKSIKRVHCKRRDAYSEVDRIMGEIGTFPGPVLLCVGATSTVLAARLAKRGVWATDLGHMGMFMRHAGSYQFKLSDLISDKYRALLLEKRLENPDWGSDGAKHADAVKAYASEIGAETILDYGCGNQDLAKAMAPQRVSGFDPGISGKDGMPKPCDLVVCADVLEHIEPEKLEAVIRHLHCITGKGVYAVIATRPARETLPDNRNAHLIVRDASWWTDELAKTFTVERFFVDEDREVRLWLRK